MGFFIRVDRRSSGVLGPLIELCSSPIKSLTTSSSSSLSAAGLVEDGACGGVGIVGEHGVFGIGVGGLELGVIFGIRDLGEVVGA